MLRSCLLVALLPLAAGCAKPGAAKPSASGTGAVPAPKGGPELGNKGEQWAGVNEWVRVGEVRVRVTRVAVQKVPLVLDNDEVVPADEELLVLWVEIENRSQAKKVYYSRWGVNVFAEGDKLSDEHGNAYKFVDHGPFVRPVGAIRDGTADIRPDAPAVRDVLCFERPVAAAKELRLTLSAIPKGEQGVFRFKIPLSAWKK